MGHMGGRRTSARCSKCRQSRATAGRWTRFTRFRVALTAPTHKETWRSTAPEICTARPFLAVDVELITPTDACRVSLLIGLGLLILKDFHAWEPLKFCFIGYTFAVIKTPREPHFPSRNQRYVLDSTRDFPFNIVCSL